MESIGVEIKTEPIDEDYSLICEEVIIKSEFDVDSNTNPVLENEIQNCFDLLIPKDELLDDDYFSKDIPFIEHDNNTVPITQAFSQPLLPQQTTLPQSPSSQQNERDCNRDFSSKLGLSNRRSLRCRSQYICNVCGQIFRTSVILQGHMQKHENKRKRKNAQIKDTQSPPHDRRKSKKLSSESGLVLFACKVCGMSFTTAQNLVNHSRIHDGNKHICNQCGKAFSSLKELRIHMIGETCAKEAIADVFTDSGSDINIKKEVDSDNECNSEEMRVETMTIDQVNVPEMQEENLVDNTVRVKKENSVTEVIEPVAHIKEEPVDSQEESSTTVTQDYDDLILQELIDRKAKSIANKKKVINASTPKKIFGSANQITINRSTGKMTINGSSYTMVVDRSPDEKKIIRSADKSAMIRSAERIAINRPTNNMAMKRSSDEKKIIGSADNMFTNRSAVMVVINGSAVANTNIGSANNKVIYRSTDKMTINGSADKIPINRSTANTNINRAADKITINSSPDKIANNRSADENTITGSAENKPNFRLSEKMPNNRLVEKMDINGSVKKITIYGSAEKKMIEQVIKEEYTQVVLPSLENTDFEQVIASSTLTLIKPKLEPVDNDYKSAQPNSTQQTTNKLPNFQTKSEIVKSLKEEYQKANSKKLGEPLSTDESSQPSSSPSTVTPALPCSWYFSIVNDIVPYTELIRKAAKNIRYTWICSMCPRRYVQRHSFEKHLLALHFKHKSQLENVMFELRPEESGTSIIPDSYCHFCRVTLADVETLQKHRKEFHKADNTMKLQFKCDKCGKYCSSRGTLADHVQANCGTEPQYGCEVCGKKFYTKSTLTLHKSMHTGDLPHACGFCNKRFRTRGQLTVHTRTHTGERPFPCKVCGRSFTHRETLIAHLSRHIDMKRYKCDGCQLLFSCISGLKTHRLTRMSTCGKFKLNARPLGPRVRVIKGNVIFEPQPKTNRRRDNGGSRENTIVKDNLPDNVQNQENFNIKNENIKSISMMEES